MKPDLKNLQQVKLSSLKPHPKNPRSITKEKYIELRDRVKRWGQLGLILVDGRDRQTILGGNHVYQAMLDEGYKEAWVEYRTPADDAEAYELLIVHNERFAEWLDDKLAELIYPYKEVIDLSKYSIDLGKTTDLKKLLARFGESDDDEFDTTPPEVAKSEEGKIYKLGRHRLMCGDATKPEDVTFLMGGKLANLLYTDPPYGVSYEGAVTGEDWDQIKNDDLRGDELEKFLVAAFRNAYNATTKEAATYVFYASRNHIQFEEALKLAGYKVRQQLIWSKNMVLGMSDYHWTHEPILYCQKGTARPPFYGNRTHKTVITTTKYTDLEKMKKEELLALILDAKQQSSIWNVRRDNGKEYNHPTQKPIALATIAVKNSTAVGDIVLDLFTGAGAIMVAAHNLDRTFYGMELDPKYADVIRKRYANAIGELENWEKVTPESID